MQARSDPDWLRRAGAPDVFEIVETWADESHGGRDLRRCRECGQLYFHDFREEIDWTEGRDGMYDTYVPVHSDAEVAMLRAAPAPFGLLGVVPRLQDDSPLGSSERALRWIGGEA